LRKRFGKHASSFLTDDVVDRLIEEYSDWQKKKKAFDPFDPWNPEEFKISISGPAYRQNISEMKLKNGYVTLSR